MTGTHTDLPGDGGRIRPRGAQGELVGAALRDLHARRQAAAYVREREMVGKLFGELSDRYRDRSGGYTRIVKTGYRAGDNAPMSIIEFVRDAEAEKAKKKAPAAKK